MTSFIAHTSIDTHDAYAQSQWWKEVLGYVDGYPGDPDDFNAPEHEECMIHDPETQHAILFINVPDDKQVKNRVHFDVRPREGTRDEEVERVLALGATVFADHRDLHGPGVGWMTLADPEGNEFCVLRSDAERAANPAEATA